MNWTTWELTLRVKGLTGTVVVLDTHEIRNAPIPESAITDEDRQALRLIHWHAQREMQAYIDRKIGMVIHA